MPEISVRGLEMPESPIRKLAPLAAAAKRRGTKVYHLNIGQPDLPTPKVALDALKHIDRNILEYSPSQGIQSYREKLVDYYRKYDINVEASIPETKSSSPNLPTPTTWLSPSQQERAFAPLRQPSTRAFHCQRWRNLRSSSTTAPAP